MARYKPQDHNSLPLPLPVVLSEQIIPGSFAFTLNYLVEHELSLSALDAQFKNNEVELELTHFRGRQTRSWRDQCRR